MSERTKRLSRDIEEEELVLGLCEQFGFGRVMQIASSEWRKKDPVGALIAICCAKEESLFKAAPDLLDALKACASAYDNNWTHSEYCNRTEECDCCYKPEECSEHSCDEEPVDACPVCDCGVADLLDAAKVARAAIAKAEGRS